MDSQINRLRKWADWGGRVKPAIRKELSEAAAAIEAQAARIADLEAALRGIVAEATSTERVPDSSILCTCEAIARRALEPKP